MSTLSTPLSGDWTDELVAPGPENARYEMTADGAHVMWLEETAHGTVRVAWDGRSSEPFELIPQRSGGPVEWSPEGLHAAWYGAREGRFFVAVDGIEYAAEGISRSVPPTFSDPGGHVAYGVYVDGVTRLMFDGQLLGQWMPAPIRPVFSTDGTRFAFVSENQQLEPGGKTRDYRQSVVLDSVEQPDATAIWTSEDLGPRFSPDGRRFAYGRIDDGEVRFVVDGAMTDPSSGMSFPTFSPDSRRFVYGATNRDGVSLVGEGVASGKSYRTIGPPVFSPDSSRLAFVGFRSKDHVVAVIDGVEGPEFADTWDNVTFSGDSRHVAYLGLRKAGGFLSRSMTASLVRDGVMGTMWDEVSSPPHFSPDGAHVAFSARRGRQWFAVLDDVPGIAFEQVGPPTFSSTGRRGYLTATRDATGSVGYRVAADGIEPPVVSELAGVTATETFVFSPDGDHVATAGLIDEEWRPIVDGTVGPGGLGVGSVRFQDGTAFFLVAGKDGAHRVSTQLSA